MIKLNIFGDFKSSDVTKLSIETSLQDIIDDSDINCLNFEAPLKEEGSSPIEKSGPSITNDDKAPEWLLKHGFNLFSLANNHICDYGGDSLTKTMNAFPEGKTVGAGSWEEAYSFRILEKDGVKIAFIAVTHHEFGVLYEESYQRDEKGSAWMLHPCIDELIIEAKQQCDYCFILPHCGMEHEYFPLPEIRTLYHHWVNIGADGIFASHPHTAQPWEDYKGHPIAYSLGNFCFESLWNTPPKYWYKSIIASVTIDDGKISMEMQHCGYDETCGKLSIINDNQFAEHLNQINNILQNHKDYIKAIDAQCAKYKDMYDAFANESGYYRMSPNFVFKLGKRVAKMLLGRMNINGTASLMNILRCETHRWTLTRILSL
mgnify:CR=1 FL=1